MNHEMTLKPERPNHPDDNDPSYTSSGWLLAVFVVGLISFFVWANWATLDIVSRAIGVVIPVSRVQTIQSVDGGILQHLYVKEGALVEQGQLLAKFDPVKAESLYRETLARVASVQATLIRTRAEIAEQNSVVFPENVQQFPEVVQTQTTLFKKRRAALEQEVAGLERSYVLAKAELGLNEPMLKTGEVSEVDVIRLRRQVNEIQGTITQRRNKYFADAQTELARAQDDFGALSEQLLGRKDLIEHIEVKAPVKGIVKNVRFTTVGGVVRPAEEILQIIPLDEELLIELKLKPADIAFLKPGLPASIKIDAYDYTIYGMLKGELTYLSPDTLREDTQREEIKFYRGLVRTKATSLRGAEANPIQIIPGMTASVDIKTGEQTVLSYLLKPLLKGVSESFNER